MVAVFPAYWPVMTPFIRNAHESITQFFATQMQRDAGKLFIFLKHKTAKSIFYVEK